MRLYRPLNQIQAMSFDLDDTLYDNKPVLERTENKVLAFLRQQHVVLETMSLDDLKKFRANVLEKEPEIYHDVSEWRRKSIVISLLDANVSQQEADRIAEEAMECFRHWRSQIDVPDETHQTLQLLAKKWPLIAITNGNADPKVFGLNEYFTFVLKSGRDGRSKPDSDMFDKAKKRLNIDAKHILHVGDDLTTDVLGAIRNGYMACWINNNNRDIKQEKEAIELPHLEISQLALLQQLL